MSEGSRTLRSSRRGMPAAASSEPGYDAHVASKVAAGARSRPAWTSQGAVRVAAATVPVALAILVATWNFGDGPFWKDEVWSMTIAGRSLGGMFEVMVNREANMALYYLFLHGWTSLGTEEGFVRLPSAMFAVATVPLTMLLARRLFGDVAAVVAGLALAVNGFLFYYSQEARAYPLVAMLTVLSALCLVRAVDQAQPSAWILYVVSASLLIYAHIFGSLLVAAQLSSLVLLPKEAINRRWVGMSALGVGIVCSPLAVFVLAKDRGQLDWIEKLSWHDPLRFSFDATGGRVQAAAFGLLGAACLVGLIWELRRHARSRELWARGLVLFWVVLPPLLLGLLSLYKPVWLDRYLIGVIPGLCLLLGLAVATLRPMRLAVAAVVVIIGANAISAARHRGRSSRGEDLRAAAAYVLEKAQAGDPVVYAPAHARMSFSYYLKRQAGGRLLPYDLALAATGESRGDVLAAEVPARVVAERLRRTRRIWVVSYPGDDWHPTPEPVLEVGPPIFRREFTRRDRKSWGIVVTLYERRKARAARRASARTVG
jgi:mannosyltransferase